MQVKRLGQAELVSWYEIENLKLSNYINIYIYIYMFVCMYIHMHIYIWIYVNISIWVLACYLKLSHNLRL